MNAIQAPYLLINQGILSPQKSFELSASAYAVVKGFFKNAVVMDSDRNVFRVENARKIGLPIFFGWLNWVYYIFPTPKITVGLVLKPGKTRISLNEMKRKVAALERRRLSSVHPEYARKFKAKIQKTTSARQLIDLVGSEHHRAWKSN